MTARELPADLASARLLDTGRAAVYLGLAPSTLKAWRTRGGGPLFQRAGRRVGYRVRDLDAFLVELDRTPVPVLRRPGGQPAALRSVS